ncbi:MAG: lipocalin-like domain-containing protein [Alphaproteobacteria bacterium]
MRAKYKTLLPVLLGVAMLISAVSGAAAQNLKGQIVGTWTLVSIQITTDGKTSNQFGPHPLGQFMFDSSGHFSTNTLNPDLPKFASNNRATGTPEENKAVVQGSIATFGTYAINPDGSVTFHYIGASFPNWIGTDQKRMIVISGDQMKYTNPGASVGGTAVLVFKRAK